MLEIQSSRLLIAVPIRVTDDIEVAARIAPEIFRPSRLARMNCERAEESIWPFPPGKEDANIPA